MEIIRGKKTSFIDAPAFAAELAGYRALHIDLGTGDGRFALHVARNCPDCFVVGIDACRENLRDASRRGPANTLFVIANACALPPELTAPERIVKVTVNFPWGSLLDGLLNGDPALLHGLAGLVHPRARLEVRLNAGALAEAGWPPEAGANRVRDALTANGFAVQPAAAMTARDLRAFPTTWARRLAYGRDPRAMCLYAVRQGAQSGF